MFATLIFSAILQISQIAIGGQTLQVEIADTPETRSKGLMDRKHLAPNTGMLFVFEKPSYQVFWMKDTMIPLSIAFFDENKKLLETIDMLVWDKSTDTPPLYRNSKPALYALEVPQHWFEDKGIEENMKFSFLDRQNQLE